MAMNYDRNALEILEILGCEASLDYQPDPRLPVMLNNFLSMARDNPLFRTPDIWVDREAYFSYEDIEERIEEDKDYWAEHPDECDDPYFPFSQIPKEKWPEKIVQRVWWCSVSVRRTWGRRIRQYICSMRWMNLSAGSGSARHCPAF